MINIYHLQGFPTSDTRKVHDNFHSFNTFFISSSQVSIQSVCFQHTVKVIFTCVCSMWHDPCGLLVMHFVCHTGQSGNCVCEACYLLFNPLAYTDVPETAGLARSINTQPAVRRNSETNPTSQHNRGMY